MARKSRKNVSVEQLTSNIFRETRWGSYARLSVKSSKKEDSISHQLQRNREFVKKNISDGILAGEYCDNGVSGTTFERPGFSELLRDIKSGKINAVIVKDFSRFGRNYLEALELLDVVFPELNVRFISIDDAYDSEDPRCSKDRIVFVIKHLSNEYYARVVSKKLSQAHEMARGNGEFWGSRPPYGFNRSMDNSKKLIIDEAATSVVVQIFNMFVLDGNSYYKIAKQLNMKGIPSPEAYFLIKNGKSECVMKNPERYLWLGDTISRIIQNPTYIGDLVTHKTEQSYYKNQKLKRVPRSQWNIEENALPRLIGQALYDQAQKESARAWSNNFRREESKKQGFFNGKVVCGICGRYMSQSKYNTKKGIKYEYHCRGHDLAPNHCKTKFINEKYLLDAVTVILDRWVKSALIEKKALKKDEFISKSEIEYRQQISLIVRELDSLVLKQQQLYEDLVDQILDKREYKELKSQYSVRSQELIEKKGDLYVDFNNEIWRYKTKNKWLTALLGKRGELCITSEIIDELVDKIVVVNKNSIKVDFKFVDINYGEKVE